MAELVEGVIKAIGQCWVITGLDHCSIVVVIINNERGRETCCAGMHEGVGCQVNKLVVKGFPFREKGGGQGHILSVVCVGGLVVIVVE